MTTIIANPVRPQYPTQVSSTTDQFFASTTLAGGKPGTWAYIYQRGADGGCKCVESFSGARSWDLAVARAAEWNAWPQTFEYQAGDERVILSAVSTDAGARDGVYETPWGELVDVTRTAPAAFDVETMF